MVTFVQFTLHLFISFLPDTTHSKIYSYHFLIYIDLQHFLAWIFYFCACMCLYGGYVLTCRIQVAYMHTSYTYSPTKISGISNVTLLTNPLYTVFWWGLATLHFVVLKPNTLRLLQNRHCKIWKVGSLQDDLIHIWHTLSCKLWADWPGMLDILLQFMCKANQQAGWKQEAQKLKGGKGWGQLNGSCKYPVMS